MKRLHEQPLQGAGKIHVFTCDCTVTRQQAVFDHAITQPRSKQQYEQAGNEHRTASMFDQIISTHAAFPLQINRNAHAIRPVANQRPENHLRD